MHNISASILFSFNSTISAVHQFNAIKVKTKLLLETVQSTYYQYNYYTVTIYTNENHTFIKRKQEYFLGYANICRYFFGYGWYTGYFLGLADIWYIFFFFFFFWGGGGGGGVNTRYWGPA